MNMCEIIRNNEYLNNFLGYGDPERAYIFYFGIEEHGEYNTVNDFIEKRNQNNTYIFESCIAKGRTERIQSRLTYKLLNKYLNLFTEYTEEQYITNNILRPYEFSSNIFPLGCSTNAIWNPINQEITGYIDKNIYRSNCWNGNENHANIISRRESILNFLNEIHNRMEEKDIWIFIMGLDLKDIYSPSVLMLPLISEVFGIDNNLIYNNDNSNINNYLGSPMYNSPDNKIWFLPHPRVLSSDDLDIIVNKIIENYD